MTAAERLRLLAGAGGTAAALLLAIGSGTTAAAALDNYSPITAGTAAEHLLSDKQSQVYGGRGRFNKEDDDVDLFRLAEDWNAITERRLAALAASEKQATRVKTTNAYSGTAKEPAAPIQDFSFEEAAALFLLMDD